MGKFRRTVTYQLSSPRGFETLNFPRQYPCSLLALRTRFAAVAQLAERLACIQEVPGSMPGGSSVEV